MGCNRLKGRELTIRTVRFAVRIIKNKGKLLSVYIDRVPNTTFAIALIVIKQ